MTFLKGLRLSFSKKAVPNSPPPAGAPPSQWPPGLGPDSAPDKITEYYLIQGLKEANAELRRRRQAAESASSAPPAPAPKDSTE